jgi:hypothetical protein
LWQALSCKSHYSITPEEMYIYCIKIIIPYFLPEKLLFIHTSLSTHNYIHIVTMLYADDSKTSEHHFVIIVSSVSKVPWF